MAQVKATESTESSKPNVERDLGPKKMIVFSDTVAGLSCDLVYIFAYDKLVRTKYIVTNEHTNKTEHLSDFDKLSSALSQKYGKPTKENTYWKNDLYRDKPEEWGMAVAVGHLAKYTSWETLTAGIILSISGDNYDITLGVEYSSKEFESLEKKTDQEQEKEKL